MSLKHSPTRAHRRFGRIPVATAESGLSRSALYGLATKHKGLFKKAGSATIVDLNMLADIIAELPDADINISDDASKPNTSERAIVRLLQERLAAERVPLSGAARGRFGGDVSVSVPVLGVDRRVEVKCRGDGFRELYKWLAGADFLIVRADRRELLIVAPLKFAVEVVTMAEQGRMR